MFAPSTQGRFNRRWLITIGTVVLAALVLLSGEEVLPNEGRSAPPSNLEDTGLYEDFETLAVDSEHLAFSPQYPLWTDGATKRRWISVPPGKTIDASDPNAWAFPIGTRFWKEFSFNGRRVETRFLQLARNGQWLYAAYMWTDDGRRAYLAPEKGKRGAYSLGGGRSHTIPGITDCKVCHEGNRTEVLGFSALQLSPERDPGALHVDKGAAFGTNLTELIELGLVTGFPKPLRDTPPRIVSRSALERAALGYMHGNCGHCHNQEGPLENVGLFLHQEAYSTGQAALASTVGHLTKKLAPGQSSEALYRIQPGHPELSGVTLRMASRYPALQMPPLGTELVDEEAISLIREWVFELGSRKTEAFEGEKGGKR